MAPTSLDPALTGVCDDEEFDTPPASVVENLLKPIYRLLVRPQAQAADEEDDGEKEPERGG